MKLNFDILKKAPKLEKNHEFGHSPEHDLEYLLEECRVYLPKVNEELIRKAFNYCVTAHKNKLRKSGEPFYTHPLAVARIVIHEIPLDDISVASALLHNVTDETDVYTIQDIKEEFGPVIAQIVEGVTKIKYVESQHINSSDQMENYRRLLLALFKDVRIILIKLADRTHNMRTLDHLTLDSQKRAANETLEVYAPFANRFGLRNIKWELEDLAFKFLNREIYDQIRQKLNLTREEREDYIRNFISPIVEALSKDELFKKLRIKYEIGGRPKHIYSIYNKTILRDKPIEELYDLFAVRVILDTEDRNMCFYVYGIIAGIYPPVPETFKDYISSPKKNGYRSIHTALIGNDQKPVEVQIRTREMHDVSEQGVAAHFKYKSGKLGSQSIMDDQHIQSWMDVVREIFENAGSDYTPELLDAVRKNLFQDEIYVFTPANEFKKLPKDSTPLDFAYEIHSEIGSHCIGAKINGKVVPLNYKLQNGDQVEILTSKNQVPGKEWLNYVVTSKASQAIQKYLKDEEKRLELEGKELWKKSISEHGLNLDNEDFNNLLKSLKFASKSEFYLALGSSKLSLNKVMEFIRYKLKGGIRKQNDSGQMQIQSGAKANEIRPKMKYQKSANDNIEIAKCCNPLPGDEIVLQKIDKHQFLLHRTECESIKKVIRTHSEDLYSITWDFIEQDQFFIEVKIIGEDREFMLQDITRTLINHGFTNLYGVKFESKDSLFEGYITIKVANNSMLQELFDQLIEIPGVKSIERNS